ncbi:hypothetical protein CSOJ01_09121 [Colletotrichum sojae]|uniref:Uncharacterized protein n=1 Tax=Colletotrichum sojae TaxID=2175907 RepID=A0A8H6J3R6_9PEZI|nr:hypothetical protein CSOJ01_09121 [Colletotrichum sojae]
MSSTVAATSSAPLPTSTSICSSNLYDPPTSDRSCSMPYGSNHTDIMKACCKDADIVSYYDNCGLYCLALDQSVKSLQDCLFKEGAGWTDVFCRDNGNVNASATATGNSKPDASASASVVASGGGSRDGDDSSATGTGASASSSSSGNAAPGVYAPAAVNTLGLALGALLLSAATFGALQI